MGRDAQEPTHYDLIPTDDVAEHVVRLWVPQMLLKAADVSNISKGMTLDAFCSALHTLKDGASNDGYGSYLLTAPAGRDGGGYLGYDFGKPKDSATREDTLWRSETVLEDYDWPPVIKLLYGLDGYEEIETEAGTQDAVVTANTRTRRVVTDRYVYVPGARLPTLTLIEEFHSAIPYTDLAAEKPVPTRVPYDYLGMRNVLDALHPQITVPQLIKAARLLEGFGTPNPQIIPWERGLIVPQTNMLDWEEHTPVDAVRFEDGIYKRLRKTVFPPEQPDAQEL